MLVPKSLGKRKHASPGQLVRRVAHDGWHEDVEGTVFREIWLQHSTGPVRAIWQTRLQATGWPENDI